MPHCVIIGAGISGLSLGWFLKQQKENIRLTLLEASDRPGGLIQTIKRDRFLFEQGPRSLSTWGAGLATLKLIEDLGMQDQVLFADPAAKIRYLFTEKQLQRLPTSFISLLSSPFFFKLLGA